FGQKREMTQPQHALAPVFPMKGDIKIYSPFAVRKAHLFFDSALGSFDTGMGDDVAIFQLLHPRLAPFQVGDLGLAGRLEHAIAGVPIGLEPDFLKYAVRNSTDNGMFIAVETQSFQRQATAAIE